MTSTQSEIAQLNRSKLLEVFNTTNLPGMLNTSDLTNLLLTCNDPTLRDTVNCQPNVEQEKQNMGAFTRMLRTVAALEYFIDDYASEFELNVQKITFVITLYSNLELHICFDISIYD